MASSKLSAIITARGGSKRIPGKNVRILCGKPLIAFSIEVALGCKEVDHCYVSTDDDGIASISENLGAEVIARPPELASDIASSYDTVLHALDEIRRDTGSFPEAFVLLQPTSPLRTAASLAKCIAGWKEEGASSAVSLTLAEHHPYKSFIVRNGMFLPMIDFSTLNTPTQQLPPAYRTNGAIYLVKTSLFLSKKTFFPFPMYPFIMPFEESVDIDTELDFFLAEALMKERMVKEGEEKDEKN